MWPQMMVESLTWQETGERMEMYITFSPSDGMYVLFQQQVTFNGQLTTVQLVLCVNEPSLRSGMSLSCSSMGSRTCLSSLSFFQLARRMFTTQLLLNPTYVGYSTVVHRNERNLELKIGRYGILFLNSHLNFLILLICSGYSIARCCHRHPLHQDARASHLQQSLPSPWIYLETSVMPISSWQVSFP